jgi:hypothetical protein
LPGCSPLSYGFGTDLKNPDGSPQRSEKGKVISDCVHLPGPATVERFVDHLAGKRRIGLVSAAPWGTSQFGAIDIDQYGTPEQPHPTWTDYFRCRCERLKLLLNATARLRDWEVARPYNFLLMPMIDPLFGYAFDRPRNQKIMLVTAFSSKQKRWFNLECINIYDGKKYRMMNSNKEKNPPHNVVFPLQFGRLLIEYQEHPEAKSLAPDGTPCKSDTKGLLKRAHIVAGEPRYIGKESDHKWGAGDTGVLDFKTTEYGRSKMVVASEEVKKDISNIGINKCARESGFDRKNVIRKLVRDIPVKRNSYNEFVLWLQRFKLLHRKQND